jgi:ADP-heptose:LPS heptosyltransferase
MPLFQRLIEARRRRRVHSRFDSRARNVVRAVERNIKFLLSSPLGWLLRPKRARLPLPLSEVSSIFILRHDALGDAVLTTPVWRAVKRLAPHIRIGVAGSPRSRPLFEHDPDVDETFAFTKAPSLSLLRELFRARRTKWDVVLNLNYHDKTRGAIFAKIIAPNGVSLTGVRGKREKYLRIYSEVVDRPPIPAPMVWQNLLVLKAAVDLPIDVETEWPDLPNFPEVSKEVEPEIKEILQRSGTKCYIIINTDASQLYREWGVANSIELARKIVSSHPDLHVFLSSAPSRASALRELLASEPSTISYLETPSILHLASAIRGAVIAVTPDTSVTHFATAQRVPVVGLFFEENEFLPIGAPSRVLIPSDRKTMSLLTVEQVYQALEDLLEETKEASSIASAD